MENPFQYENENYILLFCNEYSEFQKYINQYKETNKCVRCMTQEDEKWEELHDYVFQDEMNEEVLIQKSKKIIYKLPYQIKSNHWIEIAKKYNKEIEIENDLQIIVYEDLPKITKWKEEKHITSSLQTSLSYQNPQIHLITYIRSMPENTMYYQLQIKCVLENYKHKGVKNMIVIGKGVEETFQQIHFEKIDGKSLILINDDDDNISFFDIFTILNNLFKDEYVMILRSDMIFVQNEEMSKLWMDMEFSCKKKILAMSRLERDLQGRVIRLSPQQTLFGSMEQDAWILKTPIEIKNEKGIEMIQKIDFNEKCSELYMNQFMKKQGYKIIHDSRDYKILRLCIHPDMMRRDLIKNMSQPLEKEKIDMIPDKTYIEDISMEQWIQMLGCEEDDIHDMKIEWLNRIYKK